MYVMITQWKNHWDKIAGNRTRYDTYMFRNGMNSTQFIENETTIFIKLSDTAPHVPETAWSGSVNNISEINGKVHFTVNIVNRIEIPESYKQLSSGWYFYPDTRIVAPSEKTEKPNELRPKFFDTIVSITEFTQFENLVNVLLRYIGINDVYPFNQLKQAGRADGFFKIKNLLVMYDATLNTNFEPDKNQQIRNYVSNLNSGNISYGELNFTTTSLEKQVWIITRGKTRRINIIDDIVIKEVSVETLIQIFLEKVQDFTINETEFTNILRNV
ncbi:MAG TPA: hypothetical protein PL089_14490 [Ignavibacteria bacterium]|nr:hypothetical protein [Ignavibacteria bacterium]